MRQALAGKPVAERSPPPGVSFVDGDWLYDEFNNDSGVKELDIETLPGMVRNFFKRFGF
jgi:penicillin-binding protein 1A